LRSLDENLRLAHRDLSHPSYTKGWFDAQSGTFCFSLKDLRTMFLRLPVGQETRNEQYANHDHHQN
jgi:hypothetical protein